MLALVLALTVGLAGCTKGGSKIDGEQFLNIPFPADVRTLDSSKATDSYSGEILGETMEGLTRIIVENGLDKVINTGAKDIKISDDGKVYTFTLNDLKWTDDKPVTAEEYVYSWTRLLDPATASDYAYLVYCIKGAEEFNSGKGSAADLGIKAKDAKTLEVTLNYPVPYFTQLTAFKNLVPLRKDKVEAAGEKYGQDPAQLVYNGPFVIKSWSKGTEIVLEKNEKYYNAKAVKLKTVNFKIIKEEQTQMQAFQAKQIDITGAKGEYRAKFAKEAEANGYTINKGNDPVAAYVFFNTNDKDKLFTNAKVRLAFSIALDREDYIKNVFKRNYPAYGWAPHGLLNGKDEFRQKVEEPLKKAIADNKDPKALFQAGLKELNLDPNATYTINYLNSSTDTFSKTIAEWYANQWKTKLGVETKIDAVPDFPQFLDRTDRGEFQVASMAWGADYNDPMTFFDMWTTGNGNNPGKWSNKEYDDLVKKVALETDFAKRLEMFKKMEQILVVDDAGIAPTYYRDMYSFIHGYAKNIMQPDRKSVV